VTVNRPLVSIVTPSLNQAKFMRATLESVAMQDYPAIEHIVVDGGSNDGTVDILRSWSGHPIRWVSEKDRGQADAIAKGFALSTGTVLAWLNSDDTYLRPDAVSRLVEPFAQGARVVTAGGSYIDDLGAHIGFIPVSSRINHDSLRCLDTVLQPATFFDRALVDQFPIDTSLHYVFDWDLFIRMSATATFRSLDLAIAGYRLHGAGKTETGGYLRQRELLHIAVRYRGQRNLATLLLAGIVATYWAASWFPVGLQRRHDLLVHKVAAWSNRLTNGHGIAY